MSQDLVKSGLLEGLAQRYVVSKFEDDPFRYKSYDQY